MDGVLRTLCAPLLKARRTNTTTNGFTDRVPQASEPSGIGDAAAQTTSAVFDLVADPAVASQGDKNKVKIVPFGAGSDTNTFVMRVIGAPAFPTARSAG